ncbi:crossover junction endonuclease EME1 [Chelonus insularis]|uniref:crossover junction endonuclease EME1 n=1 Tax=Chelonus insularis TaxID=460826 RepID=UPI00158BECEC|nr:crossover junction endonuclease EME1 [Chelonus insularis]
MFLNALTMDSSNENVEYLKSVEFMDEYCASNFNISPKINDNYQSNHQYENLKNIRDNSPEKCVTLFDSNDKNPETMSASPISKRKTKRKATKIIDEDKVRAKKEATREKLQLALAKKRIKNIQPGECMRFIEADIDDDLKDCDFFSETIAMLESSYVKCCTKSLPTPNSIEWTRITEEDSIDDDNKVHTVIRRERDKHVLIIWSWEKVVQHIHDESFVAAVTSLSDQMTEKSLSLIIYGINGYFEYHKSRNKKKICNKMYDNIKNYPKISRKEFDKCLVKIQIFVECNTRLIDSSVEMSLLIYQYTKSIAEIPYKLITRERVNEQLNFYAAGENRQTIKVDRDGYGLKMLWTKHLCSFNSVTLPIAQSICAEYPSPQQLMRAYENCSEMEGELLLKDIMIKRAAGPLTTARKLGPELSRKIYIMFTSTNGDRLLN